MISRHASFGVCAVAGEIFVTGGQDFTYNSRFSSVEKYSPATDIWSAVAPLLNMRDTHTAVAVGLAMYVLGGVVGQGRAATTTVLISDSYLGGRLRPCLQPE
jgi:hypothetical protein